MKDYRLPLNLLGWTMIFGMAVLTILYLTVPASIPVVVLPVAATSTPETSGVPHIPLPTEVRGVYLTTESAKSKVRRTALYDYAKRNKMNAVVIDVKESDGTVVLDRVEPAVREAGVRGLYRIARVFVFQDPSYVARFPDEAVQKHGGGVWADYKGATWVDAASKAAWKYNVGIAKRAYELGFDEIQFDYIRFPSDGNMASINYVRHDNKRPKHEVIRDFFRYMHDQLEVKSGIPISYDLFGYTTWYVDYDLGIGQLLVDALPHATAVSAMVYPSHYGRGTLGFQNPADYPYEIIADSLKKANRLYQTREKECAELASGVRSATSTFLLPCNVPLAHHRPWIQAFDIGAVYDAAKINAQIKAMRDQGGKGYLLWNARNVYRDFASVNATLTPSQ